MCVVKDLHTVTAPLAQIGYDARGEFNLPMRLFFSKRNPEAINLHVVNENSGEIKWNLTFRNYLRNNSDARNMYAKVKLNLLKENTDGFNMIEGLFSDYTIKKGEIIRKIANMAGFNGYRFVIATNYNEIEAYKRLMDITEVAFSDKNIFHLCLYKGTEIVAVACVEFDTANSKANIKGLHSLNNKSEKILMDKINEWTKFHSSKIHIT